MIDRTTFEIGELEGRLVHLLACDTAYSLGPNLVRKGAAGFFGYAGKFEYPSGQETDEVLLSFLACDAQIDLVLAEGGTAGEAYHHAYARFDHEIDQLRKANRYYAASLLRDNRDRLRAPPCVLAHS